MNKAFLRDASRAISAHKYEVAGDGGILIPAAGAYIGGFFRARYAAPGEDFGPLHIASNRVVAQGLNKLLNLLGGHVASAPLYLAPFSGNVTPADGWTAATFPADATEFVAYTSATRLPWTTVSTSTKQLTNAAALLAATLTFNTGGPYTIRGCGLVESSVKGGTTGALIVASRFDADLTGMTAGGKLALEYAIGAVDESDA